MPRPLTPSTESAVDESMLDDHYPALSATFVPSIHAELLKGESMMFHFLCFES